MIDITPPKSRLTRNLDWIAEPIALVENSAKTAITNLNDSMSRFWSLSDPEIEEILNHHGLGGITRIFTAHYTYGSAFNQLLADRGISEPRVNLTRPRDFTVDEQNGRISLVPLPVAAEPEPPQDPVIEPPQDQVIEPPQDQVIEPPQDPVVEPVLPPGPSPEDPPVSE